jgi:hypothetical protein
MRFLGRKSTWRRWARRIGVVVALAAYLVAAIGFPIPAASAKGNGVPFPCMDHPCGCQSAEQCWRGCCCMTVEERWAWAREHNIEPPPYAERPPAHHCTDCDQHDTAKPRPCCAKGKDHTTAGGVIWVGGPGALGCHGHATAWIASGAVTLPPAAPVWQPLTPPAGWLSSAPERPLGLSLVPPDPPPRLRHS